MLDVKPEKMSSKKTLVALTKNPVSFSEHRFQISHNPYCDAMNCSLLKSPCLSSVTNLKNHYFLGINMFHPLIS